MRQPAPNSMAALVNSLLKFGGGKTMGANATYDVYRPNYNDPQSTAKQIASKKHMRIEPGPASFPEPKAPGVEKYSLYCDRTLIEPGDIIIPNPNDNLSRPAVTVMNFDESKEMNAFRSNHIGRLTLAKQDVVYTNVRFDYFGLPTGEDGLSYMEGTQLYRRARVALWWREGLKIGMRLIENPVYNGEADQELIWNIEGIAGNFPVAELELVTGRRG